MPKEKKSVTSDEAIITESSKKIRLITDPEQVALGLAGHLNHKGKQILVVHGHDAAQVTAQVYFKLASITDASGEPFKISLKKRGLVHTSPKWQSPEKISGAEMLGYLNKLFQPARLVSNSDGQALLLMDEGIAPSFVGLIAQPRYLSMFADLFPAIVDDRNLF